MHCSLSQKRTAVPTRWTVITPPSRTVRVCDGPIVPPVRNPLRAALQHRKKAQLFVAPRLLCHDWPAGRPAYVLFSTTPTRSSSTPDPSAKLVSLQTRKRRRLPERAGPMMAVGLPVFPCTGWPVAVKRSPWLSGTGVHDTSCRCTTSADPAEAPPHAGLLPSIVQPWGTARPSMVARAQLYTSSCVVPAPRVPCPSSAAQQARVSAVVIASPRD